jgi:hypothetical protein
MPHKRSKFNKASQPGQKVITLLDNRPQSVKLSHLGNISFHPSIESARIFACGRLRGSYRIEYKDQSGYLRVIKGNANPNLVHARVFHNLKGEGHLKLDIRATISRELCGLPSEIEVIKKDSLDRPKVERAGSPMSKPIDLLAFRHRGLGGYFWASTYRTFNELLERGRVVVNPAHSYSAVTNFVF